MHIRPHIQKCVSQRDETAVYLIIVTTTTSTVSPSYGLIACAEKAWNIWKFRRPMSMEISSWHMNSEMLQSDRCAQTRTENAQENWWRMRIDRTPPRLANTRLVRGCLITLTGNKRPALIYKPAQKSTRDLVNRCQIVLRWFVWRIYLPGNDEVHIKRRHATSVYECTKVSIVCVCHDPLVISA